MTHLLDKLLNAPAWAVLLVAGGLVFIEDALFVGFVLPGETAAVLGGVVASRGHVSLAAVLITVIAASILGDSVGFEVGRHLGKRVIESERMSSHHAKLEKAQALLARRGGAAVFLGRFVAFFRAVMPALAGASKMPYRTFLAWNALGGVTWSIGVVLLGYFAGESYAKIESWLGKGTAVIAALIVIAGIVVWRVRAHMTDDDD